MRHDSLTVKAGRVSVGPKIGFSHATVDGDTIRSWVTVNRQARLQ